MSGTRHHSSRGHHYVLNIPSLKTGIEQPSYDAAEGEVVTGRCYGTEWIGSGPDSSVSASRNESGADGGTVHDALDHFSFTEYLNFSDDGNGDDDYVKPTSPTISPIKATDSTIASSTSSTMNQFPQIIYNGKPFSRAHDRLNLPVTNTNGRRPLLKAHKAGCHKVLLPLWKVTSPIHRQPLRSKHRRYWSRLRQEIRSYTETDWCEIPRNSRQKHQGSRMKNLHCLPKSSNACNVSAANFSHEKNGVS